ncbi:MAG: substrate-binding domain-containing protein, partial [Chloroflexota bacterium]|nr:substrate-binding domain-containing protein [Chloroflexota bacterium]
VNRLLATHLTAGLLAIYPGALFSEQLTELYGQGVPVVTIDDQRAHTMPWVRADDSGGAYDAVRHLSGLGHRRIAHIQGPREYLVSSQRHEGYLRALADAGITPDPRLIVEGDFLPQSGYSRAKDLFDLAPEVRPTAVFASADQMAYGVMRAAEERGIAIPGDLALVGYDDDVPSAHVLPSLTTVHQPSYEMGREAIALLLKLLAAAEDPEYDSAAQAATPAPRIVLPARLVVRASCGAREASALTSAETL